ncbi:putative voltage-gated chloride channel [Talaromyces proteolyticus]|uniref:Voltage-gated chloride channel n=1 Tax=Talaromyces proteolyticus TaxID=1131652 RepID=A0AAD4KSF8_9EURO|nr:putative voltage-gated chloride channel [Talaromyces proteolyticus]KAH8696060.1 putative voltage-gated chloride channel [Talaromyces proteolyticus]
MARSVHAVLSSSYDDDDDDDYAPYPAPITAPVSPTYRRRRASARETDSLLDNDPLHYRRSTYGTSRPETFFRYNTTSTLRRSQHHSRVGSQNTRFVPALNRQESDANDINKDGFMGSSFLDERLWYDQFTSIDWVHDSIKDGIRLRQLRSRKDFRGRVLALLDGAQGWVLVALIGCITAAIAYFVDVADKSVFDLKEGVCTGSWLSSRKTCCSGEGFCDEWRSWSQILGLSRVDNEQVDLVLYVLWAVAMAVVSCILTMFTKTVVPSTISLSTLDENLGAESEPGPASPSGYYTKLRSNPAMVYYSAAGSGVAEVKVILSGFVLHGYLGLKTLIFKTLALVLSISSGMSLGKEGPYVHIATCVGNICSRMFTKYRTNDAKRREVLGASAASGVAVAFGAPIGGVLFGLEEVSYYFPPKTLFRTFFCCIAATLSLKFLNPYGTGKIVPFEVRYVSDWEIFEMGLFILLGVLGGVAGALFIKGTGMWARSFRRISIIKRWPILEVALVAFITGIISFWNRYTKLGVAELLEELTVPCDPTGVTKTGLCPEKDEILGVVKYLLWAFVIKGFLTTITFGLKVPAGIYVPSMVVGGLMGRMVGHLTQYFVVTYPDFFLFANCPAEPGVESCVTPGVYAMIAAGATMCGVTRLSITLAVILFELTGSLNHVLPFSVAILCAKWTADAIEPRSIYDLLTDMNDYPFLDNKGHPVSDQTLGDLSRSTGKHRIIDISRSPLVKAKDLRGKLDYLLMAGELDSALPIVRDTILVGLIPITDLEFALDKLDDEDTEYCIMSHDSTWTDNSSEHEEGAEVVHDFTIYIDPSPVALDVHSPLDLVYQCFVKLGLRYICVLGNGKFQGLVHKKQFVKHMRELDKI